MKKLITGAIAAIAILLGFASCSGDLHENEVAPLYIEGVTSARVPMTKVSDTEQIYKFTYSKTLGGWHNTSASIEFKTMVDKDSWARDWGAPKDETVTLKVGDEEYTPLLNREADGVGGAGPGNIEVYDLVEGQEYTIRMKVDMATLKGEIRIEGLSVAAPDMEIIVSTNASGKNAVKIPMTRGGTTYTYEFIAAKTTDIYYYFYCSALNNTYYVDNNKLEQVDIALYDAHGNLLNADGDVVVDNSYAPDGWKKAHKVSIVKDHKYSIEIVADETYKGFNGTIKYEEKVDDIKFKENEKDSKPTGTYKITDGIFKNTVLIGQWKYTDNHDGDYAVELTDGAYTFTAQGTSVGFKVLRDKSEDTMAWGGKVNIKAGTDYKPGTATTLTYKTTLVLDEKENVFAYTIPKEEKSALKEVDYITAEGLKVGAKYTISLEPERTPKSEELSKAELDEFLDKLYKVDLGTFKICLTELKPSGLLNEEVAKCGIRGNMNGWGVTEKNTDESTSTHFVFGPFTTVNPEFKLAVENWADLDHQYTYTEAPITVKNEEGAESKVTLEKSEDNAPNIKVESIAEGAEYKIIIDVDNDKEEVECTIKITKTGVKDERSDIEKFAEDNYIKGEISSGNWDNKVYADSITYDADKKSVTIKYGPFPKSSALNKQWLLTDDSVFYRSCKLRYVDLNNKKGTEVKLVADAGADTAKNNEIKDATFDEGFYFIVVRVTTGKDGNIDKVFAKIEPTTDSKLPYPTSSEVTLVITIPGTGNYKASTFTIEKLPNKGNRLAVDGSLFSWDGGKADQALWNRNKAVLEVTATGLNNSGWIAEQSPFANAYPSGADTSAKLKVLDEERWYCFKNGGSYTFDYSNRRE